MAAINEVTVYGSGCKRCQALLDASKEAVSDMGLDVEVGYVTDVVEASSKGIMSMPALVVDGSVVSTGRVLDAKGVRKLLEQAE
ncbi:MAG: thioredoxin family protein [Atopobiaceae bacterium]|jgi:small redox-active disulfide protein 2|nr:thioredoxin family protein [Atopobiaceae bacterium]MCH4181459.1 thioredoxin family protein [Atopobiaceae bacterium]MCH4214986.1 thioredoxin family protein [Atopobiaceae bacterium]MCH4230009.1 thioredoxin family protein [Atopobiaceae bacterium]MCH4277161.1 thioredoxin family protein [Atopobiaceae bacterium]